MTDIEKRFADNCDDRSFDWASLSSRAGVERESRCRPTKDGVAPLFEIAFVLVRFDHIGSLIVNPDHRMAGAGKRHNPGQTLGRE
jgi:hypothetical protein